MVLRFFKCNVLGGFRLSDINKQIRQGEFFYIEQHVAETSRAVIAALRERWMIEITEKEASKHLELPYQKAGVQETMTGFKGAVNRSANLAIPNMKEVNRSLESRQAEASNSSSLKPSIPDFKKVEEQTKERQSDSLNKVGASTDQELLKGDKSIELVAGPDFKKNHTTDQVQIKEEQKNDEEVTVKQLSDDSVFDNSQLAVPNLDDKTPKEEVKEQLDQIVRRKRRGFRKKTEQTIE
jgi:hypothetical protein